MNVFQTMLDLKDDHAKFFTNLKKVTAIGDAFLYFLIFTVIINLLSAIVTHVFAPQASAFYATSGIVFGFFFGLVMSVISIFVTTGLAHLFLLIFKAKGTYMNTFNTMIYANTPSYLMSIPILVVLALLFGSTGNVPLFILLLAIMVILALGAFVFSIILTLKGLSIQHGLGMGQVFVAVYVIPWAISFLLFFAFMAFFALFIGVFMGAGTLG